MNRGFTLTEVLIALAIILVLSAMTLPLLSNRPFSAQTDGARAEMVQIIRLARERSLAHFKNQAHGIKLLADGYVLFQGSDYATRQVDYDLPIKLSKGLTLSWQLTGSGQADEIDFFNYDAKPNRSGKIIISAGDTQSVINLNQTGIIE